MASVVHVVVAAVLLFGVVSGSPSPGSGTYEPAMSPQNGGYTKPDTESWPQTTGQGQPMPSDTSPSNPMPSYGSGKSSWGTDYDNCVSQCMAKYGSPPTTNTPQPPSTTSCPPGNGTKTHKVIVAPTQGRFIFVPFALSAAVGDTVDFVWGANVHTVTKSSGLLLCNKTAAEPFTSGQQNKSFVFSKTVNNTDAVFFYCGVPTHCQKGMFGVLNMNNASGSPYSFSNMMQNITSNNPDVGAYANMTQKNCANNTGAAQWGSGFDMSSVPDWSHSAFAQNVLFTRNFLNVNPGILKSDGYIDMTDATTLMIPPDMSVALGSSSSSAYGSAPSASSNPNAGSQKQESGSLKSGARSMPSCRTLMGLVVVVATVFNLSL